MSKHITIHAKKVLIDVGRWDVRITAVYSSGRKEEWYISADAFYTDKDHIYFDTMENALKYEEEN